MKNTIEQRIAFALDSLVKIDNDLEQQIIQCNEPTRAHYLYGLQNEVYEAIRRLKNIVE